MSRSDHGYEPSRSQRHVDSDLPNNCPRCGDPVASVTISGPSEAQVTPCGCDVHPETLNPRGVLDGGRLNGSRCDVCRDRPATGVLPDGRDACRPCATKLQEETEG